MSGLEACMKESENQMMELTKFLTDFENIQEFIAGIFVIGVLAGIGEEVFFRGLIQPKIRLYTGSIHWGIWLTAIIFSAIHMQFYGFLPRVFLGAIFGYLYVYSGSLVYPILAHIFNNSITVLLVYLAKQGNIEFDVEATDQVSYPLAFLGLLVLLVGIYYFKRLNLRNDGKLG
jgi:membrane protease YdiL (CAAX protease family)